LRISRPKKHVVGDGESGRQREVLIDCLDPGLARIQRRGEVHLVPVKDDLACVRTHGTGNGLDES